MEELLIGETNVNKLLRQKYKRFISSDWVLLIDAPVEYSFKINSESIKILQEMGYTGVYITFSKPAIELREKFEEDIDIDIDKLFFIDGISKMWGAKELEEKAEYVSGPIDLPNLKSVIYKIFNKIESDKKFVLLDSITTILLYNSLSNTLQFSHFLIETLKKERVLGVIVSVSRGVTNEKLIGELEKLSDEVIRITE